ncbi:Leucine-rich repeat-containing protein 40 [Pseudomonas reidholzensis]|uniref:Leucine-rich repeat-containing protein 40 n=1 Tax=Pseudomonas reidholzensis TaxID=1785162 RepID=A0A383RSK1_9PSED|nr:leucine-rich repeat domain-containing protein [Pseudomonas reidholzensis]SYX90049.1 Leucine-rich repeat-containing protein 40 [Pseudomonas reidholzensis]
MNADLFHPDSVDALIASRLPAWLTGASTERLGKLQQSLQRQQHSQHELAQVFARITPLHSFAAALLNRALLERHQLTLDVRQVRLRRTTVIASAPVVPGGLGNTLEEHDEVTLLAAALHNFTGSELAPSTALSSAVLVNARGEVQPLSAQAFITTCRALDIGRLYQEHLQGVLSPPGEAGRAVEVVLERSARTGLEAAVRVATLKGELDEASYFQFLPLLATAPVVPSDSAALRPCGFRLLGKQVRGAVGFEVRRGTTLEGVILWMPDDPQAALSRHDSWAAVFQALGRRFQVPGYAAYFQRFISERDRNAFSEALAGLLNSASGVAPIELDGRQQAFTAALFTQLRTTRLDTLRDDARVLATPTADADRQAREQRLAGYQRLGLNLLALASVFVPGLGLPLMGIAAAQIAEEVYEGYADWQLGDRQGALDHLFGVAENLGLTAAVAAVGVVAGRLVARSSFVDGLVPVLKDDDQLKLISAELPGYALPDRALAIGERVSGADGMYLRTHQATYRVSEDAASGELRMHHPRRAEAYAPLLEDNGEGGWRHEFETPRHWQGPGVLIRRLASDLAGLDDQGAERVMQSIGFDEDRLRRLHLEQAPAPARLRDAAQRYGLHGQQPALSGTAFEQQLAALQATDGAAEQVLRRDFQSLSAGGAREIVEHAAPAQVEQMIATQRVPLALATDARWFIRDSRVDRACAGFYQPSAVNPDTERLALGLIDGWAPWPATVRVELRDQVGSGELLAQAGPADATEVVSIVKGATGYQALAASGQALPLAAGDDSLFQALWLHLGTAQKRLMLGDGDAAQALAEALGRRAAGQREGAEGLLGMAPQPGSVRPPVRFADGRLGYRLSGGEPERVINGQVLSADDRRARQSVRAGVRQLFPHWDEEDLAWLAYELTRRPGRTLWTAYSELARQVRSLRLSLRLWRGEPTAPGYTRRLRAGLVIRQAWQPTYGATANITLALSGERIGSLPDLPPGLGFGHIRHLILRDLGLTAVADTFLQRFANLRTLQLGGNQLTALTGLERFTGLTRLNLENNRLATVAGLAQLPLLTQLRLNGNRLSELPGLGQLPQLTVLALEDNRLAALPGLGQLTLLTELDLAGNRFATVPAGLERLIRLQYLGLNGNALTAVPAEIGQLAQLTQLNLRGNRLGALPDALANLTGLVHLHLADNRFTTLPTLLGSLTELRILNLSANQLSAIPPGLERLRNLTELYLGNNQIVVDVLGGQRLEAFSHLQTLSLNGNPIGMLPPLRNLDQLRHLTLRATGLDVLPLAFLQRHPELYVDLADNAIGQLSEEALLWIRQHPRRVELRNNPLDADSLARLQAVQAQWDTLSRQG